MSLIEQYYNKFNEDKRLLSRHGQVEYITSMKYIHECLKEYENPRILDIGAGTGRYSVALSEEGYDVTAVELVKYNLGILKKKGSNVKAYQGNALNLKRFEDESFEVTLLFGPMYHLFSHEDKLRALQEAKRVTASGGTILVAYCMNEYCVLMYAFKEGHLKECLDEGRLTDDFHSVSEEKDLYDYVRLEDIDRLNRETGLNRVKIISPDGPTDYMRPVINAMDEETFKQYINYNLSICERPELVGAGAHTLDILRKE
ncbi:MAG: methyltransferase domain-containing protein [Lachnospiraceae bacterium]|nr:methyltransferase domain-containing protein [Lachnospiraceae bacterium]